MSAPVPILGPISEQSRFRTAETQELPSFYFPPFREGFTEGGCQFCQLQNRLQKNKLRHECKVMAEITKGQRCVAATVMTLCLASLAFTAIGIPQLPDPGK